MIDIEIMQDASEIIHYDSPEVSYAVQERLLSNFTDMRALCHWHDDIELLHIFDGEMNYDVNGQKYLFQKGDTIFINSRQLHYGYDNNRNDCEFMVVLIHPELLKASNYMYRRYVYPILNYATDIVIVRQNDPSGPSLTQLFENIRLCRRQSKSCHEFELLGYFYEIWSVIYKNCDIEENVATSHEDPDIQTQKQMVSYIYQHYQEHITLEDIAAAGMVSRSKCCKIFQKYLSQSPISFLNDYRMEISCNLLSDTAFSITQIATSCGFNHLSYYSKMFLQRYGCTPNAYRKAHQPAS